MLCSAAPALLAVRSSTRCVPAFDQHVEVWVAVGQLDRELPDVGRIGLVQRQIPDAGVGLDDGPQQLTTTAGDHDLVAEPVQ